MGSLARRLRRLEDSSGPERCPACAERAKRIIVRYPGDPQPDEEPCPGQ